LFEETTMNQREVIIIGGGIAGLCTGVYLKKCGFDTEILEMHAVAGGLATAWKRDGFTFENCVHWLVGSKDGGALNALWKEVFDIGRLRFHEDPVYQVLEQGDQTITIYRDPERLERELIAKAPEDVAAIKEFIRLIRKFRNFHVPEGDSLSANLRGMIRMAPFFPAFSKYGKLTMRDFSRKFQNPLLRGFFSSGIDDLTVLAILFSLAWMAEGNAGYPIGGSPKLIGLIEENYGKIGGRIRFQARVERVLVENGRAVGVRLLGGETITADIVISAADGHATIFDMLEGTFIDEKIRRIYETYKPFPSYVQVSFGVGADLAGEPGFLGIILDHAVEVDPQTEESLLTFRIFNFDPTSSPSGKTAVVTFLATYNHAYWRDLRDTDKARYDAEKRRVAEKVSALFEERFPQAKGKIEVVDVATPATVIRYTGNWQGSMEGWLLTPSTGFKGLPSVLPGLKNFYMAGQWTSPGGGLPSGLITGRAVARRICKETGVRWLGSKPFSARPGSA
jgi:phytoene dehydrogenase-like protein